MPPKPDRENRALPPILLRPNLLEIPLVVPNLMLDYEREAICDQADQNQNLVGLGPNMVEFLLTRSGLSGYVKPDGLFFRRQTNAWALRKVVEIRSGDVYEVGPKVVGFGKMVGCLRQNTPDFLRLLAQSAGKLVAPPRQIVIPENQHIEVVFVSHGKELPQEMPPASDFRVSYLKY